MVILMKAYIKKHFYFTLITAILLAITVFFVLDLLGVQNYAVRALAIVTPLAILSIFISIRDN